LNAENYEEIPKYLCEIFRKKNLAMIGFSVVKSKANNQEYGRKACNPIERIDFQETTYGKPPDSRQGVSIVVMHD
jgi:hypothetical protein